MAGARSGWGFPICLVRHAGLTVEGVPPSVSNTATTAETKFRDHGHRLASRSVLRTANRKSVSWRLKCAIMRALALM